MGQQNGTVEGLFYWSSVTSRNSPFAELINSKGFALVRMTVVTDLLNQNVPLEDVQYLAGHSSPHLRPFRLRRVTHNIVERIVILNLGKQAKAPALYNRRNDHIRMAI